MPQGLFLSDALTPDRMKKREWRFGGGLITYGTCSATMTVLDTVRRSGGQPVVTLEVPIEATITLEHTPST